MILAFELTWTGTVHATSNAANLQVIAQAFPDQSVEVFGESSHLAELERDCSAGGDHAFHFHAIPLKADHSGKTGVTSFRRFLAEFRVFRNAIRRAPNRDALLVFLLSTTATSTFAAALAAYLSGRRNVSVHVALHGNLNDARGWRSRNPLRRRFDLRSTLERRHLVPVGFLVLERVIQEAVVQLIPGLGDRIDTLPLPINPAEVAEARAPQFPPPVRIGFVGLGTEDKGFDTFLRMAQRAKSIWGAQVEFIHVGHVKEPVAEDRAACLKFPLTTEPLSRAAFVSRLEQLHYVALPFRPGYYDLSASGALIDALTFAKPILTTTVPLTEQFFSDYGDIGSLCIDEAEFFKMVEKAVVDWDDARYRQQVENLLAAREARKVTALAGRYAEIVKRRFPQFV